MPNKMLVKLGACSEAVEWVGDKSPAVAWKTCKRGDWMLWLCGKLSGEPGGKGRKKLVLAACACARLSLKYVRKGEKRPLVAIQTAEAWAKGKRGVTIEQVLTAAYAANAAATAAAYAAYADDAAYADATAAYAANAAYAAAANAADYAARRETLAKCADIVRGFYPKPPQGQPTTKGGNGNGNRVG